MQELNRSPCVSTRLTLQESAAPPAALRESLTLDRSNVTLREETRGDKTVTLVDVVVAQAGRVNRNGRLYSREVWQGAIEAAQEQIAEGKLWALLEHPEDGWDSWDPLKGRLERICLRYESLELDGDTVRATGRIVDTATGRDLKALLEGGIAVGVSSNGTGSAQYLPAKEVLPDHPDPEQFIQVIQPDFRLLTVDMVSDPSDVSGEARRRESRRQPTPPQESTMNKKLKAILDRFGMTEDEFKTQFPEQYAALTAPETPAGTPAADAGTLSADGYRALEQTVVQLRAMVDSLTAENHNAKRDAIAITALEGARLPSAGTVKSGDTEIDLDASFRAELIGVARAAESSEAAQGAVASKIAERRAVLGQRESAPVPRGSGRINLPVGDNSRTQTQAEARQGGNDTRQFESTRRSAGLL